MNAITEEEIQTGCLNFNLLVEMKHKSASLYNILLLFFSSILSPSFLSLMRFLFAFELTVGQH